MRQNCQGDKLEHPQELVFRSVFRENLCKPECTHSQNKCRSNLSMLKVVGHRKTAMTAVVVMIELSGDNDMPAESGDNGGEW